MKTREAGIFAAVAGISAVVTAGFGWPEVLIGWAVCTLLRLIFPDRNRQPLGKVSGVLLLAGGIVLAAAAAFAAERTFPDESTFPFVSLGVLALLWRSLWGRRDTARSVGNVLGLILLPLLAAVILFGLSDVSWPENLPRGFQWQQVLITVAVTSPWWTFSGKKQGWSWFFLCGIICLGMSLITRGILGTVLTEALESPLYLSVQSIHIFGTLQRFEALLAAAVLLGSFGMLLLAGEWMRQGIEILSPEGRKGWPYGGAVGMSFLLELGYQYCLDSAGYVIAWIFWGAALLFALWLVFVGKPGGRLQNP